MRDGQWEALGWASQANERQKDVREVREERSVLAFGHLVGERACPDDVKSKVTVDRSRLRGRLAMRGPEFDVGVEDVADEEDDGKEAGVVVPPKTGRRIGETEVPSCASPKREGRRPRVGEPAEDA